MCLNELCLNEPACWRRSMVLLGVTSKHFDRMSADLATVPSSAALCILSTLLPMEVSCMGFFLYENVGIDAFGVSCVSSSTSRIDSFDGDVSVHSQRLNSSGSNQLNLLRALLWACTLYLSVSILRIVSVLVMNPRILCSLVGGSSVMALTVALGLIQFFEHVFFF